MTRQRAALAVGAIVLLGALDAGAQTASSSRSFQVERFEPLPAQGINVLNVATSDVTTHERAGAGVLFHFVGGQLVERDAEGEVTARLLDTQLKAELWGAVGLKDFLDLGVVLPIVLAQSGDPLGLFGRPDESVEGAALSDLRLVSKFRLINPDGGPGIGLAILPTVIVPTGSRTTFNSDGTLRFEPRLALDWRCGCGVIVTANAAYAFRPRRVAGGYVSDDAFRWAVGTHVPIPGVAGLGALLSIFGDAPLSPDLERDGLNAPVEADLAVQIELGSGFVANLGGGRGLTKGVGSPSYRVFGSVGFVSRARDADGDGLLDSADQCPQDPEDGDGYQDEDGCPEHDNDGDGVLDIDDQCDLEREDLDGFEDANGCPDPDNDGDGLLDHEDGCPDEAGPRERNGCAEGDTDGDGIGDDTDKCPEEPEDKDGFQDEDGCVDADNDADGVLDATDQCPLVPEDVDGFEDEDGCPDPDNDGDAILDVDDKCPMQAETVDGKDDEDGCPEDTKVRVTMSRIEILEKVYFETGKAEIRKRSFPLLAEVATVLNQNPQITKVRVEGHTDDRGDNDANQKLSEDRAFAVAKHLIEQGNVEITRLDSEGYGESRPIADNKRATGREQNRRVEFVIVEINGQPAANPFKPRPKIEPPTPTDEALEPETPPNTGTN